MLDCASARRSGAILTIDLGAIRANYRLLRRRVGQAACSAVLKSDAYGLGAARVASALYQEGCRHFFVAHVDEGIALRPHLAPDADIFVLHGAPPGAEADFTANGLIPVLNCLQQVSGWRSHACALQRTLPAIIQVDSGMSRMGLAAREIDAWLSDPHFLDGIELRCVMSHLACADEINHPMNAQQLARFCAIRARLPHCPASLANSSGIFLSCDYHFDLVRPGAALYGIAPNATQQMHPVVRLQGKVLQTRTIERGDHVGYGVRYSASETQQVATVSVGYADGWLRSMSNVGIAIVDGIKVPLIGTVSMDSSTFNVSAVPAHCIAPGCLIDLICVEHTVDAVASLAGTIGYEVLTGLGPRLHRHYVDSNDPYHAQKEGQRSMDSA
ncbi:MAG: alanine racemase [Janthinobacterium sp.]|jgi:alanine racemase